MYNQNYKGHEFSMALHEVTQGKIFICFKCLKEFYYTIHFINIDYYREWDGIHWVIVKLTCNESIIKNILE